MDKVKKRVDLWKSAKSLPVLFTTEEKDSFTREDEELVSQIEQRRKDFYTQNGKGEASESEGLSQGKVLQTAKELIFDVVDSKPIFHIILHAFNARRGELQVTHLLDQIISGETAEEIKDEVKNTLAFAYIYRVPVYPNTEEIAPILARYHRDLMIEGFTAPDESGKRVEWKLVNSPGELVESIGYFKELKLCETHCPAELALLKDAVLGEIKRRDEAGRILASLRLAINELSELLNSHSRNENKLQECLTSNPILFGTDYICVIPKHRLGAEYEMDYALERVSGIFDLVEIESSTHVLFTKKGDPSQHLIHAEQQVLDWLNWIEHHHPYAREGLPGIMRPVGYVIIGRRKMLIDKAKERLKRRNILFRGTLEILTYDDLLEKANNLLNILCGRVEE